MNAKTLKKHLKTALSLAAAAILCGASRAEEPVGVSETAEPVGWNYELGGGLSRGETPIVSGEFSLAWDSRYLTYGLVDNNDPIVTPAGYLTFFDWLTIGVSAIFDTTGYGEGAGYYSRRWLYQELDPEVSLGHSFGNADFGWIPAGLGSVEFSFGWMYEHHPNSYTGEDDGNWDDNTSFAMFEIGLPDLWLEPCLSYERDLRRDHGTYLNLSLGHAFALVDGAAEDDEPVLSFRPSVGQGWGDRRRVAGYLSNFRTREWDGGEGSYAYEPLERNGLMDTAIKGELTWRICPCLALSGYVQYSDYIFDRHLREGARVYEATGSHKYSHVFTCGLALTATF